MKINRRGMLLLVLIAAGSVLGSGCGRRETTVVVFAPPQAGPGAVASAPLPAPVSGVIPGAHPDAQPVVAGALGQELDAMVIPYLQTEGGFNGTVTVARAGQVLLNKGYGVMDATTGAPMPAHAVWDWASVSKQFTGAAVLKLRMHGRLQLDDSISRYVPNVPADKAGITLRHLLTHTSGIETEGDWTQGLGDGTSAGFAAGFLGLSMVAQPGTRYEYNNWGYTMVAATVERASGQRFQDFVTQHLFRPAGMNEASFPYEPGVDLSRVPRDDHGRGPQYAESMEKPWTWAGAGGAMMSGMEMVRWDRAVRTNAVLDDAAREDWYRPALESYALGWGVQPMDGGETLWCHEGANVRSSTVLIRGKLSQIVIAIAVSHRSEKHSELANALFEKVRATP